MGFRVEWTTIPYLSRFVNDKPATHDHNHFRARFKAAIAEGAALPKPNEKEAKRSQQLAALIRDRIKAQGDLITFAKFMETALYEPGLGYYVAENIIFGAEGDFLTAPEISDLFGICIARQCTQVLQQINNGNILEIGAGSGVLAATILNDLAKHDSLPDKYFILERSERLRDKQLETIKNNAGSFADRVQWLSQLPESFTGVIIGNEILDALPVKRFIINENNFHELCVATQNGEFTWTQGSPLPLASHRLGKNKFPQGYVSEINPAAEEFTKSIVNCLDTGIALFFDYGYPRTEYYLPDRQDGTLMCYYRHRTHNNPFTLPGLQDITSFIDFTAIAESAVSAGADVLGYTSQAGFLMSMGLDQLMAEKSNIDSEQVQDVKKHLEMSQAVQKLTLPHEMGELIKVIALGKNTEQPLTGFLLQDRRHRL